MEIPLEYWNKLASQTVLISSLLGGFSILVIANLLIAETKTRISKYILVAATCAGCSFIITIFAFTSIMMMTTVGYPKIIVVSDFFFHRVLGVLTLMLGIVSLLSMISLVGWTKSKRLGVITTMFAGLSWILILAAIFID